MVSDVLENANWFGCFSFMGRTCYFYVQKMRVFFVFIFLYETIESLPYEVDCLCLSFGYPELVLN